MERRCLGLIAAMPEEIAPLLRRLGRCQRETVNGFSLYRFSLNQSAVVLVQSGMGPKHAAAATETLISQASPDLILNFGFGGGVLSGLAVADLVLAEQVFLLERGVLIEAPQPDAALSASVAESLAAAGIAATRGGFITAAAIMNKQEVAGTVNGRAGNPVLEMESAAVLRAAERAGIPVVALRGISDAADEELGFSLEEFCDGDLNLKLPRVLLCVARKPRIIPQLLRLAGNTKRAGKHLALAVEAALRALA